MQAKEAIAKFVNIITQIEALNEDLKVIKDDAKAAELNVPVLVVVAKAIVSGKIEELLVKSTETLEAIETSRS